VARKNGIAGGKIQCTIDQTTLRVLDKMVPLGLHGRNRAEVASWILREWIWHNQERLDRNGIMIRTQK
jgi:hypothetical protein